MQGQVSRLARLSTDLLDLSRVDAGQLTVVLEPVDLGGVVEMLAGELGHLAVSTGHDLRTAIDDDVWCLGDDARILQIGRALATNAMTHTAAGTTVTLRARRRGDRAELSVDDDGPGIPTTQREAVFGRFYRVEGGMASGSGLGLAIAREIARIMGGDVRLDSAERPTRLTLELPGEPIPPGAPRSARAFSRENGAQAPERVPQG
jgi:two-component system OmpR family sensor kinase